MKKLLKQAIFLLSAICLFVLIIGAAGHPKSQYTIDTPYQYPIVPGTQEWIELDGVLERRRVCQIPDEILHNMTTDALLQSVLDYPFLNNIYAYNTLEQGYEAVKRQFNGLRELEMRPDFLETLSQYCVESYSLETDEKTLKNYMTERIYSLFVSEEDPAVCPYGSCQMNPPDL